MDEAEKRTVKRKRHVFAENVDWTNSLLGELHRLNLVDQEALDAIKVETSAASRVSQILDHILMAIEPDGFTRLCSALKPDYPWLSEELELDLRVERAEVNIEDEVTKDAAILVHRKFGQSKRFSEMDKKEIQDLIALKVQLSKDDWKKDTQTLREERDHFKQLCQDKDEKASEIDSQVVNYIREHNGYLTTHAHTLKTTSSTLMNSANDLDIIMQLKARVTFLLDRLNFGIKNGCMLQKERERCLELLNCEKNDGKLYSIIQDKMTELPNKIKELSKLNHEKKEEIDELKKTVSILEKQVTSQEVQIRYFENESVSKDAQTSILENKVEELEQYVVELAHRAERRRSSGGKTGKSD